jgi:uncharacterized protein (DUF736 family)
MSTDNTSINPNQIGALWGQESKQGNTYYRGEITVPEDWQPGQVVRIVLFKNTKKPAGSKAPDWRINKEIPKEEWQRQQTGGQQESPTTPAPQPAATASVPASRPAAPAMQRGQQRPRPARPAATPAPQNTGSGTL